MLDLARPLRKGGPDRFNRLSTPLLERDFRLNLPAPTIEFAPDSPLEGEGSELLVPLDLHSADRRSSGEASKD